MKSNFSVDEMKVLIYVTYFHVFIECSLVDPSLICGYPPLTLLVSKSAERLM